MKIVKICLLILWMTLIFYFSNQNAVQSSNASDGFISKTVVKVYKIFYVNESVEDTEEIISKYTYPIRKLAHYSLYFILVILIYFTLKDYTNNNLLLYSLLFCFFYACTDEFHQLFVMGRSASFKDVFLDTFGSFCSILIITVINKRRKYSCVK